MKWYRFRTLAHTHEWLAGEVDIHTLMHNPLASSYEPERINKIRDFVKHHVEYIAFHPLRRMETELRMPRRGNLKTRYEEEWYLLCKNPLGKYFPWKVEDGSTVMATIQTAASTLHSSPCVPKFVIKRTTEGSCGTAAGQTLKNLSLTIYEIPEGIWDFWATRWGLIRIRSVKMH
jgi:hypothetical protein